MAITQWTGAADGDLDNDANWSGVTAAQDDTAIFENATQAVTTDLDGLGAITGLDIRVGATMAGAIGTASVPLETSTGTTLTYNGVTCPLSNWDLETATEVKVLGTSGAANAFILSLGTTTDFYAVGGNIVIDGATITNLYVLGGNVTVTAGSTISTKVEQDGGSLKVACALPATVNVNGGTCEHNGASVNCGTVTVRGGMFLPNTPGSTITLVVARGAGVIDFTQISGQRTVTNSQTWHGGVINVGDASHNVTLSNATKIYKGTLLGTPSAAADTEF